MKISNFTLVEFSIVLVIIGLIISGVMICYDLVEASHKNQIKTINRIAPQVDSHIIVNAVDEKEEALKAPLTFFTIRCDVKSGCGILNSDGTYDDFSPLDDNVGDYQCNKR